MNILRITGCSHSTDRIAPLLGHVPDLCLNTRPNTDEATLFLAEHCPDLILTDSDATGQLELLPFIRRHAGRIPAMVLLVHPHENLTEEFLMAGAQDVLPAAGLTAAECSRAIHMAPLRHRRDRHLHEALEQSQKMEAVGRMAGGVAHDYNNLLTVIMNNAILARDTLSPDMPARADLDEQIRVIKQAAALTRRLLVMSRSKPPVLEQVDVCSLVAGMKKMFRHVTGDRIRQQLSLDEKPVLIQANSLQVEQALLNLVINACDAMWYEGTLTITVGIGNLLNEKDHLYFAEPGNQEQTAAYISVADTGSGISDDILPHIFEPFFTTKKTDRGTGIGLYQVYSAVQQHQGAISVYSTTGKGSEFRLFFPLHCDPPTDSPVESAVAQTTTSSSGEIILLVEDDPGVRQTTRRLLESLGYEIIEAENGREALELGDALLQNIDLLFSDIMMPDMDGVQLADALRIRCPHLRVILSSGYPDEKLARQGLLPEKYAFIAKPFLDDHLALLLRTLLNE